MDGGVPAKQKKKKIVNYKEYYKHLKNFSIFIIHQNHHNTEHQISVASNWKTGPSKLLEMCSDL